MPDSLARLETTIRARRSADPARSYVARLTAKGRAEIARKIGEEAIETIIAALSGDRAATTSEVADLVFHLAVLLADMDLGFTEVMIELDRREGVSGLDEKAARARD